MQKFITFFLLLLSLLLVITPLFKQFYTDFQEESYSFLGKVQVSDKEKTVTVTTLSSLTASLPAAEESKNFYAAAYCLMDAKCGRILSGKETGKKLPMASTTKIMTCIIALEQGNLEDTVTVSSYAASMPDVQLGMKKDDQFILKDLLYSLMLESHNDTAVAIAEHIGGSVEGFAGRMNEKAEELGLVNTHFVTPNGLDDKEHFTTAEELCLLAAYAITNPQFIEITNTPSCTITELRSGKSYALRNHNAFLNMYEGAIGVKTGFTNNAGYCFAGAVKQGDKTLVSSVLACGWPPNKSYKWSDTSRLMNYGLHNYENSSIQPDEITLPSLPVTGGVKGTSGLLLTDKEKFSLLLSGKDTVCHKLLLPTKLTAPLREGDVVGELVYEVNGTPLHSIPIAAGENIRKADYSWYLGKVLQRYFFHLQA